MQKETKKTIAAAVLYGLFLLLVLLLKTTDVKPAGPAAAAVGLSGLNSGFFSLVGEHPLFTDLSNGIGVIAIATVLFFAFLGLLQLIKRKSFFAVDTDLYILACLYAAIFAIYLFFLKFIINCRPILENGEFAASFPSSHTLLGITVFGSAALQFKRRLTNKKLRKALILACQILTLLIILFRLLCGLHWLTDILGSILIGSALLLTYDICCHKLPNKNQSEVKP